MPPTFDLAGLSVPELFGVYLGALRELRARDVLRTDNNPAGDYAEVLFCAALGWTRHPISAPKADAVDAAGVRYQVKSRRPTTGNPSRQLGDLYDLDKKPFDVLAGVLFTEDFNVSRAALVPYATVLASSKEARPGLWRFYLRDSVWALPGVRDVTAELRAVER